MGPKEAVGILESPFQGSVGFLSGLFIGEGTLASCKLFVIRTSSSSDKFKPGLSSSS